MTRSQVFIFEGVIVLVAIAILYAIVGWPFGSGGGDAVGDDPPGFVIGGNGEDDDTGDDDTGDDDTGGDDDGAPGRPDCGPTIDQSFLSANQIVSYYGNPYAEVLGILGQHEPEEVVRLLKGHAANIDALNGLRGVQPALHMVYATAQPQPGENGLYLLYVDEVTLKEYIDLACENGLLIFLDLQVGRSTPEEEVRKIFPYLKQNHVHVALDPEFTMPPGEIPGQSIGFISGPTINSVQELLQGFVVDSGIADKILIVHQFDEAMIPEKEAIASYGRVRLVIDMDGFGPSATKVRKFNSFAVPAEHSGIKLFFKQDTPVMTDEEVVALLPDVIIYQ